MPDVSVATQRDRLLAWLERRGADDSATLRETHISILAFTADRVWKCKKAVRFPFIDLSSCARRLANCEREVALNRRLAPDVYFGVVPLVDDRGMVVDHLVEMRRLPDDRRLSALVAGAAGSGCVEEIADLLARFHAQTPTGEDINRSATPEALAQLWTRSLEELKPFAGPVLDPLTCEGIGVDALRYLAGRSTLFANRVSDGRIRDGHGDLLADDVFCVGDGPRVLDCLEFDDRLRFGDVLADVAFLAMDLERLQRRDLAARLLERYQDQTGDHWPSSLEHFYVAYRALVRTKVSCLRVADDANAAESARELLAIAAQHLMQGRIRMVLIGGTPATGKTTLAQALARVTGWPVFHSDEVRKRLAGVEETTSAAAPLHRGLYTDSWSDRTYAALLDHARIQLMGGTSVILDASWGSEHRRSDADQLAAATASKVTRFVCEVPPSVADARASIRAQKHDDASDASADIAAELRAGFAPWPQAVVMDTTEPPDRLVDQIVTHLRLAVPQAWSGRAEIPKNYRGGSR